MQSDFAVNKYLHTVASGWIFINIELRCTEPRVKKIYTYIKNWKLGFKKWKLGFKNWKLGFKNWKLGFKNWKLGFKNWKLGCKNWKLGFMNWKIGFKNWKFGFKMLVKIQPDVTVCRYLFTAK